MRDVWFRAAPTYVSATHEFAKNLNPAERIALRDAMLASGLANSPDQWNSMLKKGLRFSAVPEDPAAIREKLGIRNNHVVVVAPVFSGEWSRIHPHSIGIDFSREALRKHPNSRKIKADLRSIPLPYEYADHVISYEPTPLQPGTATIMDALMTLHELSRIGKNVHIIQRVFRGKPLWTYPFIQHYLAGIGVKYRLTDITNEVRVTTRLPVRGNLQVQALSFKGGEVMQKKETLLEDIETSYRFLKAIAKAGKLTPMVVRSFMRKASPALQKAFTEQYLLGRNPHWRLHRDKLL